VAGIGHLKIKWSRPIAETIKTVTLKRDADQWYVTFSCEVDIEPVSVAAKPAVGIDMGLDVRHEVAYVIVRQEDRTRCPIICTLRGTAPRQRGVECPRTMYP